MFVWGRVHIVMSFVDEIVVGDGDTKEVVVEVVTMMVL